MRGLIRLFFVSVIATSVGGCSCDKMDPCENCQVLPEGAAVFVGTWQWEQTIMGSRLQPHDSSPVHKDTITPLTTGQEVELTISIDGTYSWLVGGNVEIGCIQVKDIFRREPSVYVCEDVFIFDVTFSQADHSEVFYIKCDSIDYAHEGGGSLFLRAVVSTNT
jgi:hypothetical protein